MKNPILLAALIIQTVSWSQLSTATMQQSLEAKKQLKNQSLFQKVTLENVGPTVMSGRVVDVAVNPENPTDRKSVV